MHPPEIVAAARSLHDDGWTGTPSPSSSGFLRPLSCTGVAATGDARIRSIAGPGAPAATEWRSTTGSTPTSSAGTWETGTSPSVVARIGCRAVESYSTHWPCLFPQHGPGRKHLRPITPERWQGAIVQRCPGRLLRGLIHSDGCRVVNWARPRPDSRRYEYPRYLFSDKSEDILGICERALDQLGIAHRRPRWDMISVAGREAVARLDEHVGPKC